jgi:hypothetical protein
MVHLNLHCSRGPLRPRDYQKLLETIHLHRRLAPLPLKKNVEVMWLKTRRNQEICAMLVKNPFARLTLLYSHGNAADLGQMHDLYVELSSLLEINVFG